MIESAQYRFISEQKNRCDVLRNEQIEPDVPWMTFCPVVFDGLLCWPRTLAPSTAIAPCPPPPVIGYNNNSVNPVASKVCLESGEWYTNREKIARSNYTLCTTSSSFYVSYVTKFDQELGNYDGDRNSTLLKKWLPVTKIVSRIGYASSLTTLVIAFVIFSLLRKLRNPRNRLHMHLFVSFIMRAFMTLLKDSVFVEGIGIAWDVVMVDGENAFIQEHNTWVCKTITSLWQYFIVANYAWILMEGLYLHNLVFLALCTDTSAITLYIFLGWGLPCMVVIPWIAVRLTMEDTLCWTTHKNSSLFLIIRIPIMMSILCNFVLFVNIVRVLLVKLKTSVYLQRKKMRYRKWAKSTLVLVPLFGAHYTMFMGLSYYKDTSIELVWLFCDQLFASFQGCFVALLYCLLNSEVRAEVRKTWKAQRSRRGAESLSLAQRELPRTTNLRVTFHRSHRICANHNATENCETVIR
ncbi:secretin receptor-like [Diprion similis]|uniref:secretin receptor-like n=1 Tax=Diprion similis TaxID=362088 RepID=UPI001EF77641|nr:secretin receptor-like [Diprion similis]